MANEGSTKPTYSNEELMANCQRERRLLGDKYDALEAELVRVRGLLQRIAEFFLQVVLDLATFPRSSQNQTVAGGVEGAHEGTTADKSELLPTQLPKDDF